MKYTTKELLNLVRVMEDNNIEEVDLTNSATLLASLFPGRYEEENGRLVFLEEN